MKLWFSCCLILGATFVSGSITTEKTFDPYKTLQEIDEKFWQQIYTYHQKQLKRYQKTLAGLFDAECSISQNVTNYLEPICKDGLAELFDPKYENSRIDFRNADRNINFSNASMLDIISSFYQILQFKVDNRDEKYVTNFIKKISSIDKIEEEKIIDPYFLKIFIGKNLYHFCLNYDGNSMSKQTGNCVIRKILIDKETGMECPFAAEYWTSFAELNKSRKFLFNLLLCLEVSRRKIEDPERFRNFEKVDGSKLKIPGGKDIYWDLPILGSIVIGLELMNDQIIDKSDFFITGEKYCCFSEKDPNDQKEREEHIKNLLQTYCRYKNFQMVNQFLEEVQRLYKQFVGLKVTDRVLYSGKEGTFIPAITQKEQEIENLKRTVNIFSSIRTAINYASDVHVVDIADDDNNFFYAILQCLQPNVRYINIVQGDGNWQVAEILRKFLSPLSEERDRIVFPFPEEFWGNLEEKLNRQVIVLDATSRDANCVKHLCPVSGSWFLHNISKKYKQAIILLWRGDRWQAVLPD